MKRIVFLDFDGIVNRKMWINEDGKWVCRLGNPSDMIVNDLQAVQWVSEFCEKFEYDIVVTSNWREQPTYAECLRSAGLRESIKILGATSLPVRSRADEIADYLSEHNDIESYLVFDTDVTLLHDKNRIFEYGENSCARLILCNENHGFGESEYRNAVAAHLSIIHKNTQDLSIISYDKSDAKQLYKIALELLYVSGGLSTSILQRRLKIGYGRAASVIDFLIDAEIAFRDISDFPIRYKPLLEYDKAIERFRLFYADKAE